MKDFDIDPNDCPNCSEKARADTAWRGALVIDKSHQAEMRKRKELQAEVERLRTENEALRKVLISIRGILIEVMYGRLPERSVIPMALGDIDNATREEFKETAAERLERYRL